jgi:hypothetical protein
MAHQDIHSVRVHGAADRPVNLGYIQFAAQQRPAEVHLNAGGARTEHRRMLFAGYRQQGKHDGSCRAFASQFRQGLFNRQQRDAFLAQSLDYAV